MRYVLDSNVALKWVLKEPDSPKAIKIRDEFRKGMYELLSPDVFPVEVAHALAKAERRGILQPPEAERRLADALATPPRSIPICPSSRERSPSHPRPASASMIASTWRSPSGRVAHC